MDNRIYQMHPFCQYFYSVVYRERVFCYSSVWAPKAGIVRGTERLPVYISPNEEALL